MTDQFGGVGVDDKNKMQYCAGEDKKEEDKSLRAIVKKKYLALKETSGSLHFFSFMTKVNQRKQTLTLR